jgi:competence protein ComEA
MSCTHARQLFFAVLLGVLFAVSPGASAASRNAQVQGVVNLNTATLEELTRLPGVGEKKAQRILDHRTKHAFASTDQLMKVKGFGRITYRKLKPHLATAGTTTLTVMTAPPTKGPPDGAAKGGAVRAGG